MTVPSADGSVDAHELAKDEETHFMGFFGQAHVRDVGIRWD